jgi:hypothetical protein
MENKKSADKEQLTVDGILDKLEEITKQMDKSNQRFDIEAVNLAFNLYQDWCSKKLQIETWNQVAKYNRACLRINYAGHGVDFMNQDKVISLNPSLEQTIDEYHKLLKQEKDGWQEELETEFENGYRKKSEKAKT